MNQATTPDATAFCPRCEYDVRGLDTPRCPECGNVFTLTVTYAQSLDDERAVAGGLHIIISVLAIITAGIAIESQLNTSLKRSAQNWANATLAAFACAALIVSGGLAVRALVRSRIVRAPVNAIERGRALGRMSICIVCQTGVLMSLAGVILALGSKP